MSGKLETVREMKEMSGNFAKFFKNENS